MNSEAHLAIGWILAHCGGNESRRFRQLVVIAALAPDIDVLAIVGGFNTYARYHHTIGHNIFFSFLCTGLCVLAFRHKPWKMALFSQIAFYTHYFGDYFLTRFPLQFFWPISYHSYIYSYRIGLDHPINLIFGYLSLVTIVVMGVMFKRTPMELISPKLDQRIVNLFRRRTLRCHLCDRGATETCSRCHRPACMRHGRINRRFEVVCLQCSDGRVM